MADRTEDASAQFQESILRARLRRRRPARRIRDRDHARAEAKEKMLSSRATTGPLDDWRNTAGHARLVSASMAKAEGLQYGPLPLRAERVDGATTEAREGFRQHPNEVLRAAYSTCKDTRLAFTAKSRSSVNVRKHIESPYFGDHSAAPAQPVSSGYTTASEMRAARKQADYSRALSTFGSLNSLGFGADFDCKRRSFDRSERKFNSLSN